MGNTRKASISALFYLLDVYFGSWKWELRVWGVIYWELGAERVNISIGTRFDPDY